MNRDIIHSEYPFTEAEDAGAWILLGTPATDAIRDSAHLRAVLTAELDDQSPADDATSGWFAGSPRVRFVGDFAPAIHLAADISSGGKLLSEKARAAWLERWTVRVSIEEAELRVDGLARLGADWAEHRAEFLRLLTSGTLP